MKMKEEHTWHGVKPKEQLYRIGMFAQMNRITVKTLRFYEEQGMLSPAYVDSSSGYRYYTMAQMAVIHRILAWKQAGFTLEDIRYLEQSENKKAILLKKKAELVGQIADLTKQLARIEEYLQEDEVAIQKPVLMKRLPEVTVASSKSRIDSYDELFSLMPDMGAEMEQQGCECAIPEYCFTRYLEPEYKEEKILIETCEAVTKQGKDSETLTFQTLPETDAACIFHKGSYANFPETYAIILRYIEENDYEIVGAIRESYIDGIWNQEREEDWLSEIQIPVRRKEE